MNIIWNPNPLRTVIEVDDADKAIMRDKIMIEELRNFIYDLEHRFDEESKRYDPESVVKALRDYDHKKMHERVEKRLEEAVAELKSIHVGDCTCIPCSCFKCHAEYYLNVDTLEGLGKHEASNIISAFGGYGEEGAGDVFTIDQALENLKNYKVEPFEENEAWKGSRFTKEYYDSWIPEWEKQHKRAYEWLLDYKNKHMFGEF